MTGQVYYKHAALSVTVCLACWLGYGKQCAASVLVASAVYTVPHGWMAYRYFSKPSLSAKAWVRRLYRLEAQKLMLTMLLFAAVFIGMSVVPWVFFASYVLHVLFGLYWLGLVKEEL